MGLSSLLRQVAKIQDPASIQAALRSLYSGVTGPVRAGLYEAVRAAERGEEIPPVLQRLLENPQLKRTSLLSPSLKQRLEELIRGLRHSNGARRTFTPEKLAIEDFMRSDTQLVRRVVSSWQNYERRLIKHKTAGIPLPGDSLTIYRSLTEGHLLLEGVALPLRRRVVETGERFLPLRGKFIFEDGSFRPSMEMIPKLTRLREFYGVPVSPEVRDKLLEAFDGLSVMDEDKKIYWNLPKARFAAARRLLPGQPRWLHEALIHLYVTRSLPADDFGFVLRAARLFRGIATQDAHRHGFTPYQLKMEKSHWMRRSEFRIAAVLYGVSYDRLAYAYMKSLVPDLDLERLSFYRKPVFVERMESAKFRRYRPNRPSLGERLTFARLERDWSREEFEDMLAARGFDTRSYAKIEDNRNCPTYKYLRTLSELLDIPLDEALSLLRRTYCPQAKHPRLDAEPIYLAPGETRDIQKLLSYEKKPGSLGEEIFFRRRRRGVSLSHLAQTAGISETRLRLMEENRLRPAEEETRALAAAFDVAPDFLKGKSDTMRPPQAPQGVVQKALGRSGSVNWNKQWVRPTLRTFEQLVAESEMSPEELAMELNRRFAPDVDLAVYASLMGRVIYISCRADERKLKNYLETGRQTLGEALFFARKDLSRNWSARTAAGKYLTMRPLDLDRIEWNRLTPGDRRLRKLASAYQLDFERLRQLRDSEKTSNLSFQGSDTGPDSVEAVPIIKEHP